jgi:hypothetical protein
VSGAVARFLEDQTLTSGYEIVFVCMIAGSPGEWLMRILNVEDDPKIASFLGKGLREADSWSRPYQMVRRSPSCVTERF